MYWWGHYEIEAHGVVCFFQTRLLIKRVEKVVVNVTLHLKNWQIYLWEAAGSKSAEEKIQKRELGGCSHICSTAIGQWVELVVAK